MHSDLLKEIARVQTQLRVNVYSSVTLFCAATTLSFGMRFGSVGAVVALLTAAVACVAVVLVGLVSCIAFCLAMARSRWATAIAHFGTVPIAALTCVLGYVVGSTLAVLFAGCLMSSGLAAYRVGMAPDDGVEVVSDHPEVFAYRSGYLPGFASPGDTHLIVLDRSGRFADLASRGRVRDLATSDSLRSRHYTAYCHLAVSHWLGPYYFAASSDVDNCDPP